MYYEITTLEYVSQLEKKSVTDWQNVLYLFKKINPPINIISPISTAITIMTTIATPAKEKKHHFSQ